MVINVTQDDIENVIRDSGGDCPIARAMERAGMDNPCVTRSRLTWGGWDGESRKRIRTTKPMKDFIKAFDAGHPVEPQRFIVKTEE